MFTQRRIALHCTALMHSFIHSIHCAIIVNLELSERCFVDIRTCWMKWRRKIHLQFILFDLRCCCWMLKPLKSSIFLCNFHFFRSVLKYGRKNNAKQVLNLNFIQWNFHHTITFTIATKTTTTATKTTTAKQSSATFKLAKVVIIYPEKEYLVVVILFYDLIIKNRIAWHL